MVCTLLADQKSNLKHHSDRGRGESLCVLGLVRAYDGMTLLMINLPQWQPLDGPGSDNQL